jgi:hypothetical protein
MLKINAMNFTEGDDDNEIGRRCERRGECSTSKWDRPQDIEGSVAVATILNQCDLELTSDSSNKTMPPSLRFTQPNSLTPRPDPSTTLITTSSTSVPNIPVTPFDEISQTLRFNARVPIAGMHSSNHACDTVRTGIHLPSSSFSTIEPFETIEFDGSSLK